MNCMQLGNCAERNAGLPGHLATRAGGLQHICAASLELPGGCTLVTSETDDVIGLIILYVLKVMIHACDLRAGLAVK